MRLGSERAHRSVADQVHVAARIGRARAAAQRGVQCGSRAAPSHAVPPAHRRIQVLQRALLSVSTVG